MKQNQPLLLSVPFLAIVIQLWVVIVPLLGLHCLDILIQGCLGALWHGVPVTCLPPILSKPEGTVPGSPCVVDNCIFHWHSELLLKVWCMTANRTAKTKFPVCIPWLSVKSIQIVEGFLEVDLACFTLHKIPPAAMSMAINSHYQSEWRIGPWYLREGFVRGYKKALPHEAPLSPVTGMEEERMRNVEWQTWREKDKLRGEEKGRQRKMEWVEWKEKNCQGDEEIMIWKVRVSAGREKKGSKEEERVRERDNPGVISCWHRVYL